MILDGRRFMLNQGESLDEQFRIKNADGSGYLTLTGAYTVSMTSEYEGSSTTLGSVSIVDSAPDYIRWQITDTESAALEEGVYSGVIRLTGITDTDETIDVLSVNLVVYEKAWLQQIPINEWNVLDMLSLDKDDFSRAKLRNAIHLAEVRFLQWIPETVREHCIEYGWAPRIVVEAERLASLMVRLDYFDGDQDVRADIKEEEGVIRGITIDTDYDGNRDEGSSSMVKLIRHRDITDDHDRYKWDRGRLRMTGYTPLKDLI